MAIPRLTWRPLIVGGVHDPELRAALRNVSGAYAIRVKRSGSVVYVGCSTQGVMWKTLTRHFNAPVTFTAPKPKGGGNKFAVSSPGDYEIAYRVTSRGHRTKEREDKRALRLEGLWIAAFYEAGEPLKNDEIPVDADAFDFGANVKENPALPPVNVPAEKRAENRTPDLWTRRTKLEEGGKAARRDWKGDAERMAVELAECRRASRPIVVVETPRAPVARPEGYGETDERGQARMFKGNPARVVLDPLATIYFSRSSAHVAYDKGPKHGAPRLLDDRGTLATFEAQSTVEAPILGKWLIAAIKAARGYRGSVRGGYIPSETTRTREIADFWVGFARALPKPPTKVSDFDRLPWDARRISGKTYVENTPDGSTVLEARDEQAGAALALLANLARMGEVLRKLPESATQFEIVERMAKVRRRLEAVEERRGASARLSDVDWRAEQIGLAIEQEALELAYEVADPPPAPVAVVPLPPGRTPAELLRAIEAGPAHSLPSADVPPQDAASARELVAARLIDELPPRGRWPWRYVVTAAGSHRLGTFDSDDDSFRADSRAAGAAARAARARGAKDVPGYGAEETRGRKAGQLRMFNPSGGVAAPRGKLVELGILTGLGELSWNLRDAPILAYDEAKPPRLFIVYAGKVIRPSSSDERREYARTHWGAKGKGDVRGGAYAVAPFALVDGAGGTIQYTTRKGADRALTDYVHRWGEGGRGRCVPPTVVAHECGKPGCKWNGAVALVGGSYSVSERGIVG